MKTVLEQRHINNLDIFLDLALKSMANTNKDISAHAQNAQAAMEFKQVVLQMNEELKEINAQPQEEPKKAKK